MKCHRLANGLAVLRANNKIKNPLPPDPGRDRPKTPVFLREMTVRTLPGTPRGAEGAKSKILNRLKHSQDGVTMGLVIEAHGSENHPNRPHTPSQTPPKPPYGGFWEGLGRGSGVVLVFFEVSGWVSGPVGFDGSGHSDPARRMGSALRTQVHFLAISYTHRYR